MAHVTQVLSAIGAGGHLVKPVNLADLEKLLAELRSGGLAS
jgi:hypothetical protein